MLKRTSVLAALLLLSSCTRPSAPAPEAAKPEAARPEAAKPEADEPTPDTQIVAGKPRPEDIGATDTSPPPPEGTPRCSASSLNPEPRATRKPLPGPVESMRRRIIAAAANCDFTALAALARENGADFKFDSATDLEASLREREKKGEPVLERLVRVLNMPHTQLNTLYIWPSAYSQQPTAEDWKALEDVYSPEEVAAFRADPEGYDGFRTSINQSGDWRFIHTGAE